MPVKAQASCKLGATLFHPRTTKEVSGPAARFAFFVLRRGFQICKNIPLTGKFNSFHLELFLAGSCGGSATFDILLDRCVASWELAYTFSRVVARALRS